APVAGGYQVTFGGALANSNQPEMSATAGGGAIAFVTLVTDGTDDQTSVPGDLTVGDGAANPATVRWTASDQVPDDATVLVNNDGTLDLNGQAELVGFLQILDGQATTGNAGFLQLTDPSVSLDMAGGTFSTAVGGQLVLNGDVTATSTPA